MADPRGPVRYVVVTRKSGLPISIHGTIEGAGNQIHKTRTFHAYKVMAQMGLTAGAPMRSLTRTEKLALEKCLYPGLFE